jgi:hypothetical protein
VIRKCLFAFTLLLFLFFIPILTKAEERSISLNFWPLFQYTSDTEEGVTEIDGLGPFFSWRKDPARKQWGIRPILNWTEQETEPLKRLEFLYPFGKYQIKEGEKKGYLFLLSQYREEEFDSKKKWDFQFFPFFIGETEDGRDYGGLFPIFGTLYERYGKDEIRFYLWPIYGASTAEGARTTTLLWPFFSFTKGEKKRGCRFWPIYGRKEEIGVSDTEFFLWPIFIKQRKGLDTDDPVEDRMIFPFYVSRESKRSESKTYLWPLFSHSIDRTTNFEKWDFPWPFFQTLKGENLKGIRIFPFYGDKSREGEMRRIFILYPLYQLQEDRIGDVQEKTTRILLFNRIRSGEDNQGLEKERSLRIWPFFDYEKDETGHQTLSFFYLFPFKDEGFERNLFPLFRIFRWEKDPGKRTSTNLLWGFFKRMKKVEKSRPGEEIDSWEIAHLVGMRKEKGSKTLSFLKGLFRYQSDEEAIHLRIFFLPLHFHRSPRSSSISPLEKPTYSVGGEDAAVQSQESLIEPGSAEEGAIISVEDARSLVLDGEGGFKSNDKELANGQQEDRYIRDRFISSGEGSFQF